MFCYLIYTIIQVLMSTTWDFHNCNFLFICTDFTPERKMCTNKNYNVWQAKRPTTTKPISIHRMCDRGVFDYKQVLNWSPHKIWNVQYSRTFIYFSQYVILVVHPVSVSLWVRRVKKKWKVNLLNNNSIRAIDTQFLNEFINRNNRIQSRATD